MHTQFERVDENPKNARQAAVFKFGYGVKSATYPNVVRHGSSVSMFKKHILALVGQRR
jgi:hypothetical protein